MAVTAASAEVLAALACVGTGAINYRSNSEIPQEVRSAVAEKADAFVAAVGSGDVPGLTALFTRQAWAEIEKLGTEKFLSLAREMTSGNRSIVEQHHMRGRRAGTFNPILRVSEPEKHLITLPPFDSEAFLLLLAFDQGHRQSLVGLYFVREQESWRVHTAYVGGLLSVGGRRARGWFEDARRLMESNQPLPAALRLAAAARCLRPFATFQYEFEDEARELNRRVVAEATKVAPLPMRLEGVPGTPMLLRLDVAFGKDEIVPLVDVLTSAPLAPGGPLAEQAAAIQSVILDRLPGLCSGAPAYTLKAFNEDPTDPRRKYRFYGIEEPCPH